MTLIDDLLFKILILLPAHTLFRLQFVSKKWFQLINSPIFIECHARQSVTVLICRKLTFSGEEELRSYFYFMDLDRVGNNFIKSISVELYDVLASRDGLILARFGEYEKLMILNPITRKQLVLPMLKSSRIIQEWFGIAFSNEAKTYKIVHVYSNEVGCISCNILSLSTRKWRWIEGPLYNQLDDMWGVPLTVGESLYWIKRPCDYYLSMNLKDEKFVSKNFPIGYMAYWDKLVEIEGRLGFVHHAQVDVMQVWVLMDEGRSAENWVRLYSFSLGMVDNKFYMPICCTRNGMEIVIEGPNHMLYVYNFERMK